jgi:hypothetical protein
VYSSLFSNADLRPIVGGPLALHRLQVHLVGRQGQIDADHVVAAHLNLLALLRSFWRLSKTGLPVIRDERLVGVIVRGPLACA